MFAHARSICLILAVAGWSAAMGAFSQSSAPAAAADSILRAADAAKLLPASVFFAGQSAPVQLRNSGGVKFADGKLVLAVLVDTSGYSSAVQQKYQTYLITEAPVEIGGHALPAGAYGAGFVAGRFGVMDLGSHELFSVAAKRDAELKRPTPLQVMTDGDAGRYRLYQGREYIVISAGGEPQ